MRSPHTYVGEVFAMLAKTGERSAIKYLTPNYVVKATWHQRPRKNSRNHTILVSFGQPNYAERKFIRDCKKAGVPFPVRKIQVRRWPKAR